jgi:hypothetical protein
VIQYRTFKLPNDEGPAMRLPSLRFTVNRMMIAIAAFDRPRLFGPSVPIEPMHQGAGS